MKRIIKFVISLSLGASILFVLGSCGSAGSGSQGTAPPANGSGDMGAVASCGTHNDQPFYIGYVDSFGGALAAFSEVNLSEDADVAGDSTWVAVYVPGGSTRVAVVKILYDASEDTFYPLNNVGWAKLAADQYLTFAAYIPEDTPNLAVVVYSDDWETQQAFTLRHDDTTGLVLAEVTLDE